MQRKPLLIPDLFIDTLLLQFNNTNFLYFRYLWFGENKKIKTTNKTVFASRRQLTKVLGIVIIVFNICWLPWLTVDLLSSFKLIPDNNYLRSEIMAFGVVVNSSINPVIYSLQSNNFRQHVWGIFKKKKLNNLN